MSVSDIITLLGLLLAVVAIVNEKHRNHLLLKMNSVDTTIFILTYLLIIYLVYFDSFYEQKLYLDMFMVSKGMKPNTWAFVITNASIIFLFYKIRWSFFSHRKSDMVIKYYDTLMRRNDIDFLLDLLERYHLKDIVEMLSALPNENIEYDVRKELNLRFTKKTWRQKINQFYYERKILIFNLISISKVNRRFYAHRILNEIVGVPEFIKLSANSRPYFFALFIEHLTKNRKGHFPEDMVRNYYYELLINRNFWLKKEIKDSDVSSFALSQDDFEENKIIGAIFKDLSVVEASLVWKGFADAALKELKEQIELKEISYLIKEYEDKMLLYEQTTYQAIQLFNLLLKEAIAKHNNYHMWLFYYSYFVESIMEYIEEIKIPEYSKGKTNYHHIVETIIDNMRDWIKFNNQVMESEIYLDTITCLGNTLQIITENDLLGKDFIVEQLDSILYLYCSLNNSEGLNTAGIRSRLEEILVKPSQVGNLDNYYKYFGVAWENFDKIPHRHMVGGDYDYFKQLKDNVINKII